jgi:hypothetical protein
MAWGAEGTLGLVPVLEGAWSACRLPNSKSHGWPQPWLPRVQQLAAPSTACEHAAMKGTTGRPVKLVRAQQALGVRKQRPRSGPHTRRNTTSASPAQLSGVATGY